MDESVDSASPAQAGPASEHDLWHADSRGADLPHTGNRAVDEVLASCADLETLELSERLRRLDAAGQALSRILDSSRDGAIPTLPGITLPDLAPGGAQAS